MHKYFLLGSQSLSMELSWSWLMKEVITPREGDELGKAEETMEESFRSLVGGLRFIRTEWERSGLRKCGERESVARVSEGGGDRGLVLPTELDFFGCRGGVRRNGGEKRGRKRGRVVETEDEDEDEDRGEGSVVREVAAVVRKRNGIRVEAGVLVPDPTERFEGMGLPRKLLACLSSMGMEAPTPVQMQVVLAMKAGFDVLAVAPTGSGKTLAYVIPILVDIAKAHSGNGRKDGTSDPLALILVPTQELAEQIGRVIERVVEHWPGFHPKVKVLTTKAAVAGLVGGNGRADVVIATPLRLITALRREPPALRLSCTETIVLDEADKLFEIGFLEQVDDVLDILRQARHSSRCHLFSASIPPSVEDMARTILTNPVKIVVGAKKYGGGMAAVDTLGSHVSQEFKFVGGQGEQGKILAVRQMLREGLEAPVLVFVQSKERASLLFRELAYEGVTVDAIHADRTHAQREQAIARFRSGKLWLLIATDLLARGIDFAGVNTVINYDCPTSAIAYIHRIGRTGRAGRHGKAITLFTEQDRPFLRPMVNVALASGTEVPAWMQNLPKTLQRSKKKRMT